jgi:3-hydroxyisobutyrate dehydrogenase-like beta-hydroxyacid dehydrogenase
MDARATIGLTGLAVMGRNLARNIARHGHSIAVHNRTTAKMTALLEEYGDEGDFVGSESLEDFVASIERPRAIVIMVKAGEPTDAVIDGLVPLLDEGDIVVDGGNAHVTDTLRHEKALGEKGLHFVGMGVSRGRVRRHAADRRVLRPAPQRRRHRAGRDRRDLPGVEPRRPVSRSSSRSPRSCSTTPTPPPGGRSSTS